MEIEKLIHISIDKWEADGIYNEKFRLPLTAKHSLVVGKWEMDGEWGVDLRRWSYDQARLLGKALTLDESAWQWVFSTIYGLHDEDVFTKYGILPRGAFDKELQLPDSFAIKTSLFDEGSRPYFCINLMRHHQPVWRGKATPASIMIRFETISNFISQAQDTGLATKRERSKDKKRVDPKTGREIF